MDENQENIEKYLRGELSKAQRLSFESRLKKEPSLAEDFQLEKDIFNSVRSYSHQKRKEELQRLIQEEASQSGLQRFVRQWNIWPIWLILLLSISFIAWLLYNKTQTPANAEQLYAQYTDYNFKYQVKSGDAPAVLTQIESLLSAKKYQQALPLLEEYLSQNPEDSEILLAKGLAILEANQNYEEALALFDQVIAQDNAYLADAYWLIAITYLRTGQGSKSVEYLHKIPPTSRKSDAAQQFIQDIQNAGLD